MSHAGDVSVHEAHEMLLERPGCVLIDVRTRAEWTWVGVPDVAGARFVEWSMWPGGEVNPSFVETASEGIDQATPILMLCRSGGRSAAAATALTEAGYTAVYNIADGFEGHLDANGHRSGGWRGAGLPWHQS